MRNPSGRFSDAEMESQGEEDLAPEQTTGYKAGEKKTLEEYQKLGEWLDKCGGAQQSLPRYPGYGPGATWSEQPSVSPAGPLNSLE